MINFKHIDASSTEHALSVLAQYGEGARVLAGGQDLLFRIKKYIVKPECVVNIKTIPGLSYVRSKPQENLKNRRAHDVVADRSFIRVAAKVQCLGPGGGSGRFAADPQHGHLGRKHLSGCLVLVSAGRILLLEIGRQVLRSGGRRQPLLRQYHGRPPLPLESSVGYGRCVGSPGCSKSI